MVIIRRLTSFLLAQVQVLICTPTVLSNYSPLLYPNIETVATAGEPTSQDLADLWASKATYWNCCGPTETTIVNTMSRHVCGQGVSIGRPTPNNSVYILDEQNKPVAEGVAGIMWAGGLGVSRGYVALPAKTSQSYIPDPFAGDGSLMYCTGDLGRWRPDGSIEILGRSDDQVKVKGFRVELDGVSSAMASAPGVSRATTLLVDGQLHGFIVPAQQDAKAVLDHTSKSQPYYAVPSRIHQLDEFPMTANGKIDKKSLRAMTKAEPNESDCGTLVEQRSIRSVSSTWTLAAAVAGPMEAPVSEDIPDKQWPQPWRGLRHRVLIIYRLLFSLIGLLNLGALVAVVLAKPGVECMATLTAANLVAAVLVRQDGVINGLYTLFCSMPRSAPLWIRRRCAKIYHLGGLHSGAGFCATAWLLAATLRSTIAYAQGRASRDSLATLVTSWLLSALCAAMVVFALPGFRKRHHNAFERLHRFLGWTAVALFWLRTVSSVFDSTPPGADIGLALVRSPGFWMLGLATCSIASSWLFLRRVPVDAVPLSDHAIQLNFGYTVPVNGTFTRVSTRPLLEWHSFATIPIPQPCGIATDRGYSLIVSNAGDWTKRCIRSPPSSLWVRGLPTCGVMRITTLFNRVLIMATGSGIGPMLGHISRPSCPTQLIWSAPTPEKTFGKSIMDTIHQSLPNAIIHDTKEKGRPDLVKMGYNTAKAFAAEAVVIIANEKITKKVVYGLETRGIAAFGAIWDS
ncbi:hypothetical protein CDD82_1825 [Ophiocordyceps australis]|uniref:AMP-dependent synthetase/ligase domain-containing protein n=1 Tax=Ophiocordyceps australis TaxID=1399860 RepID=A0A2C5YA94_9HYPO|nr:hypothetical protein CDD82_1825 [Ophiocordyceps australis]